MVFTVDAQRLPVVTSVFDVKLYDSTRLPDEYKDEIIQPHPDLRLSYGKSF